MLVRLLGAGLHHGARGHGAGQPALYLGAEGLGDGLPEAAGLADDLPHAVHLGPRQAQGLRVAAQFGELDRSQESCPELEPETQGVCHLL